MAKAAVRSDMPRWCLAGRNPHKWQKLNGLLLSGHRPAPDKDKIGRTARTSRTLRTVRTVRTMGQPGRWDRWDAAPRYST